MGTTTEQVELGTAVAEREDRPVGPSIDDMMLRAVEQGGKEAVEALAELIALRNQEEDRAAERAMVEALAAFQEDCPPIKRTADGHHGKFASLDEIVRVVRPLLAKHGLTFAHNGTMTEDGRVRVTCTLEHVAGATRTATFEGPPDKSGGKNPIQEMASTRSYLRRYTLTDVLGLSTEADDDAASAGPVAGTITAKQAANLRDLAEEAEADVQAFLGIYAVGSFEDLPANVYAAAEGILKRRLAKKNAKAGA